MDGGAPGRVWRSKTGKFFFLSLNFKGDGTIVNEKKTLLKRNSLYEAQ